MVELLVMRHAKSAWDTADPDFHRPLNSRGSAAADRMARWLVENELCPDAVLSSSAVRARDTVIAVVAECGVDRARVEYEDALYLAGLFDWVPVLKEQTVDRLLICGHNPGLDDLVEYLSDEPPAYSSSGKLMTTAAIAHLVFETPWTEIDARRGRLVAITRPRELAAE